MAHYISNVGPNARAICSLSSFHIVNDPPIILVRCRLNLYSPSSPSLNRIRKPQLAIMEDQDRDSFYAEVLITMIKCIENVTVTCLMRITFTL